jgi:hypothetical protein
LLWLTLAVACWFGGRTWQKRLDAPVYRESREVGGVQTEKVLTRDGEVWERTIVVHRDWESTGKLSSDRIAEIESHAK